MQTINGSTLARFTGLLIAGAGLLAPVMASAATNRAPTISGTPATAILAGKTYSFTPLAKDADRNTLTFSISSKPSWASFDAKTGKLSGTPSNDRVGSYEEIVISVSDGRLRTSLREFAIEVKDNADLNHRPTITGTAPTTATGGKAYSFQPKAADADGDALVYDVINKPVWASFDTKTGRLYGTPTNAQAKVYASIEIGVSDGHARQRLRAFSITVVAGVVATSRNVSLSWLPPMANVDGTTLTNLKGYRIHYGIESGKYTKTLDVNTAGVTRYVVENVPTGRYYFAVTAINTNGIASGMSQEVVAY